MIIIPQTKGGVGKSTVAMQVIAPYLYKKHGKKSLIQKLMMKIMIHNLLQELKQ